ncbi:hypothetical protein KP509_25G028500 [Ceratopteris richardii]|uniref:PPM-type phosphatase domain-containing protein n=1 Tax=Ceratopteris richardii TaxID=49495 RepID=A0A8T2RRR8_CERRI|nr:hypothetical protein KP509_25G028500 [Ceratopteris richardii]
MSTLNHNDQENVHVREKNTTVVFGGTVAVSARGKRLEITRLKKATCSTSASRGLSSVQHNIFKRARPLRTSSICSVCSLSNSINEDESGSIPITIPSEEHIVPFPSKFIAEFNVPKSFGCLHAGQCILHIKRNSTDRMVVDVKGHLATVFHYEQGKTLKERSLELPLQKSDINDAVDLGCLKYQPSIGSGSGVVAMNPDNNGDDSPDKEGNVVMNEGVNSNGPGHGTIMSDATESLPPDLDDGMVSNISTRNAQVEPPNSAGPPLSGKVLVCGRRREMEDAAVIVPHFTQIPIVIGAEGTCDLHFFGVYDGHSGSQASNFCADRFHHALSEELATANVAADMEDNSEWKAVMKSCFLKVDREVGGVCPNGVCDNVDSSANCCINAIAPENVGTTAVIAVLTPAQIVVANCGDSRAVLSRGGTAVPVSVDHKPGSEDETSRIEAAGGRVIHWDGYRVAGLLAVSRSLGDRYLKQYVISEPDVLCVPRTKDDECLILASDGLWDVISNETACDVARRCLAHARRKYEHRRSEHGDDTACAQVAALLVKLAYGRGSKDNISVVVIDLKSGPS